MKEDHFKVYINRHNQMRPLQCDNCGKKFNRKNEAKRHLINTCQHTSESEMACPIYFKILKNVETVYTKKKIGLSALIAKNSPSIKVQYYGMLSQSMQICCTMYVNVQILFIFIAAQEV